MKLLFINDDKDFLGRVSSNNLSNNIHNGVVCESDGFWNDVDSDVNVETIIEVSDSINKEVPRVSINEISNMNIIMNDNDCGDTFFQDVCSILENDGVNFTTTSKCLDINQVGSIIITLDQQYNSGMPTLIFAPYDNTRVGDSDALALCMYSAFRQNGFLVDDIISGKTGFREESDGTISEIVPTETEEEIDANSDSSFVTISLGTQEITAEDTARSIENAIGRLHCYIENHDSSTDLMYRAKAGEDVLMIADYFNTSETELRKFNHLDNEEKLAYAKTIVNPSVGDIDYLDYNVEFKIDGINEKTY